MTEGRRLDAVDVKPLLDRFIADEALDAQFAQTALTHWLSLANDLISLWDSTDSPIVVGICGAQGSGKSTLAKLLRRMIELHGSHTAINFSLDDLYLSRAAREALAEDVHPLFATRGVPGTHDVALGVRTLDVLKRGVFPDEGVPIPAFDKGTDDLVPHDRWGRVHARPDIILFEGWCVGARPLAADQLVDPVNRLEREQDPDGTWRRFANSQLDGQYKELFATLDALVYLKAPDFSVVRRWRGKQEAQLRRSMATAPGGSHKNATMNDKALDDFVQLYERITRNLMDSMTGYADTTYYLREDQSVAGKTGSVLMKTGSMGS